MVKQRLLTLLPAFDIEIGGQEFGSIEKQFTFFKPKYNLDYNGWRCEGDFLAWDYVVYSRVQRGRPYLQRTLPLGRYLRH